MWIYSSRLKMPDNQAREKAPDLMFNLRYKTILASQSVHASAGPA